MGRAGGLIVGAFYLLIAGPFVALALLLGVPLVSNNPKWRGADT
jgi:hypothetical protein